MKKLFLLIIACLMTFAAPAAQVEMTTNKGVMVIDIDEENAPITAANFLQYVRSGFFDGLIFHRIIPGFVIQGGGFMPEMQRRPTKAPVPYELNDLKNLQYTLSMARTQDPHSATSQFFVNLRDNAQLDPQGERPGYAVFGKVIEGQDVVDAIATVPTATVGQFRDVPQDDVMIEKAIIMGEKS